VSLGFYALPLVGIGALLRLIAHGRWRALGLAVAGFGLIFIGIETLQDGMRTLAGRVDLAALPAAGFLGHLPAVAIGTLMTVIMQSSSAAVATTLTALHTEAVNFDQAASLVIGAAIGTTFTGALAAIGGSVPAKRTALTHVLFNLATGVIAVLMLPAWLWALALAQRHAGLEPGAVSLAAFHTAFIGVGVALFLPAAEPFARRIERLLPDQGPRLTRHLDDTLLQAPAVALEATRRTLMDVTLALIDLLAPLLDSAVRSVEEQRRTEVAAALERTQRFFAHIPAIAEDEPVSALRIAQLHAIDHLARLVGRLELPAAVHRALVQAPLQSARTHCREVLGLARAGAVGGTPADRLEQMERGALALDELRRVKRLEILRQTAAGQRGPTEAMAALDAVRWLEQVAYHTWRACRHLAEQRSAPTGGSEQEPAVLDE
jgi:phosphate:Na+ symporter